MVRRRWNTVPCKNRRGTSHADKASSIFCNSTWYWTKMMTLAFGSSRQILFNCKSTACTFEPKRAARLGLSFSRERASHAGSNVHGRCGVLHCGQISWPANHSWMQDLQKRWPHLVTEHSWGVMGPMQIGHSICSRLSLSNSPSTRSKYAMRLWYCRSFSSASFLLTSSRFNLFCESFRSASSSAPGKPESASFCSLAIFWLAFCISCRWRSRTFRFSSRVEATAAPTSSPRPSGEKKLLNCKSSTGRSPRAS
mmetsp:Transcript_16579/g.49479  ORF Transcript_16579/g.49479 Transcript_16579/m.49479 type:complete len:253 (-) Transcript_16579:956-1714(-)